MSDLVLRSDPAPGVALLTLNRPEARNALNLALREALTGHIEALAGEAAIGCVVIAGNEKIFVAGADLKAVATATSGEMKVSGLHRIWDVLSAFEKPLVMAVRGVALGAGCELAMLGDVIVAGQSARFGQPEIKVGIMPGAGGVHRLMRLVGRARAMRMVLTGEAIDGTTAFQWGLASDAVPDDQVLARALSYAEAIAAGPRAAAQKIKRTANAGANLPLAEALMLEREAFWSLFGTADQREGMAAFLEKRQAVFNAADD